MLNITYVGIAFSLVFYVVFGVAVRFMELTDKARNKARLIILISSYVAACRKYSSDIYFLISVFFTALSSVFEHHLPDMGYAIFFLSVFALKEKQVTIEGTV